MRPCFNDGMYNTGAVDYRFQNSAAGDAKRVAGEKFEWDTGQSFPYFAEDKAHRSGQRHAHRILHGPNVQPRIACKGRIDLADIPPLIQRGNNLSYLAQPKCKLKLTNNSKIFEIGISINEILSNSFLSATPDKV